VYILKLLALRLYRIAKQRFIEDLSGEGARLYGGRWNKKGTSMLYFSEHLSLCVLEILVHIEQQLISNNFYFIEVEVPDNIIKSIPKEELPLNWQSNVLVSSTQDFGSEWIASNKGLALKIPSAVLGYENNVIVNPSHTSFSKLKVIRIEKLNLDARL